jgi:hypothetical protein
LIYVGIPSLMLALEVGSCPMPLLKPGVDLGMSAHSIHEIPGQRSILCYENGIVERITLSLFSILSREGERAHPWLEEAVKRDCYPLLARLDIALREVVKLPNSDKSSWAGRARDSLIGPAMKRLFEASVERARSGSV